VSLAKQDRGVDVVGHHLAREGHLLVGIHYQFQKEVVKA